MSPSLTAILLLAVATSGVAQVQVTTYHYDVNRSGANLSETVLTTSNVSESTFAKLFSRAVDGQILAQPLYLPAVQIPGQGEHNVVYVATEHDSVFAFDADTASASAPLWQVSLGTSLPASVIDSTRDLLPEIGITGTPVIDTGSGTLYVVAETYENSNAVFRLHALDVTSGAEKFGGPMVIQGSVPGSGVGSSNDVLAFNPLMHWQRPGLLFANGKIYIGFGGHQDTEPYHGWMFAYDATTLLRTTIRCFSPNSSASGVWQAGVGLAADSAGFVYMQTGQGPFDINTGGSDYGDTIVKLDPNNNLAVTDYFTPSDQALLNSTDADFGSSGPLLIPGTSLGVSDGKDGIVYLWNQNNLGKYNSTNQVVQEWQGTRSLAQTGGGGFFAGNVFYNSTLYTWGENDVLKAYAFNGSVFNTTPTEGTVTLPGGYSNEPGMSVSANGTTPGSGILWVTYSSNGGSNGNPFPGIVRAFDASNVTHELWNSNQDPGRDYSGSWAKWCPPTIANGRVYIATFDNVLNVYGLLPISGSGQLTGSGNSSATAVNLTSEGTADWVHWGDSALNRKAGVAAQLSSYTVVGSGVASSYNNDPRPVSWSDGTPTVSSSGNLKGAYISGTGQGFSITAPADTTTRTLVVHLGGYSSSAMLTAHLSDYSAADFLDTTSTATGQYDRNYTLTYQAGSPGQTLTVTWAMASGSGNVTLNAAALSIAPSAPSSITASGGTPQSATVNTTFTTALQATVKDSGGNPISGVTVTFTAPGSGASGTFSGSASVTTDTNGIATAPSFTANSISGSYAVTASVSGVTSMASFSLTNTAVTGSGSLSGSGTSSAASVNLTTEGSTDWVHWGDSSLNRKSGVTAQLSGYTVVGGGAVSSYNNDPRPLSWSDGTPTVSSSGNLNGVYSNGTGRGFSITAPADTTARTLVVHLGGWESGGTLTAQLSDGSAANYTDVTTTATGQYDRNYTLTYSAGSAGQTLTVSWVMSSGAGNVTLNAAALTVGGSANIVASGGTPQSATVGTAFAIALQATVTNGVNPVSGVTVTFTAPGSGASGTFAGGATSASVATGTSGIAVAPTFTANSQAGGYSLTASAPGVPETATFSLTNSAGAPANIVASAGTPQSATVQTAFAMALQATVKDSGGNPLSGVTVTFAAPASGASGTFAGGTASANVATGSNGIALAPTFTANTQTGGYTVTASVSGVTSTASFQLTNIAPGQNWYNTAWNSRKPITINSAQVSGGSSLANFPLLFSVTDPNLATVANGGGTGKSDGSDILFTASDGLTKLNHQLESYNPSTGQITAWVQVPSVSATANTLIYVYYGNASAPNEQNPAGTWDPNYLAVYHMADDAGSTVVTDSTGVNNATATADTNTLTTAGEVAGALLFNGSSDYLTVPQSGNFSLHAHAFTLETWLEDNSTAANLATFHRLMSWYDGVNNIQLGLGQDSTAAQREFYLMNAPSSALPAVVSIGNAPTGFNHVVVTYDGSSTYHIYLNGVLSDGGSLKPGNVTALTGNSTNLYLGQRGDGNAATYLDGILDETRISNVARSPGWITTEYTNQRSPGSFFSEGAVQAQSGDSLIASGGTPQSATVGTAFAVPLQATVMNGGGNPVSGVTVTFTAPGSGASGTFSGSASVMTDTNGIATAPSFTANSTSGGYTVTASLTGNASVASFSLTNTALAAGTLSGTATNSNAAVNLTSEGTADWEHWGDSALNRKAGVTAQLSNYTVVGVGGVLNYNNDPRPISWSDGTPTVSSSGNLNGVYINGTGRGFSITAPADTTTRTLVVHVGGWKSGGTLTAHLSDGSAVDYQNVTSIVNGQYDWNYTLTYQAASPGQTLTVTWAMSSGNGNVTLNAASLH